MIPAAPRDFVASSHHGVIDLEWSAAAGDRATVDYVLVRNDGVVRYVAATSYSDDSINPSQSYAYTLVARNAAALRSAPITILTEVDTR